MAQILSNTEARGASAAPKHAASQPWGAPAPLRLWHLASLDAPTVAVVWTLAFAWVANVRLPLWAPLLLGLVTWVFYVGDRLLDARAGNTSGKTARLRERHRFHWRHRRRLTILAVTAACAAASLALINVPPGALLRDRIAVILSGRSESKNLRLADLTVAAAALVYFAGVHTGRGRVGWPPIAAARRWLNKEMLVGILFTTGCALPAWNRTAEPWPMLAPLVFFAVLAWLNCHAIEQWENSCEAPGPPAHETAILPIAALLGVTGFLLAAWLSAGQPRMAALIACGAASALLLGLLDRLRPHLTPLTLRALADLVLLAPLALLWR